MSALVLKRSSELTADDYRQHPLWVDYYEAGDLDVLADFGFYVDAARSQVAALDKPGHYSFRAPATANQSAFYFARPSAIITTPNGTELIGYHSGPAIGVFGPRDGRLFIFNVNLERERLADGRALAARTGDTDVFPLTVRIVLTDKVSSFP